MIERRSILKCLAGLVAAPAIIKVSSLMPVNAALQPDGLWTLDDFTLRIMQPMLDKLEQQVADSVIYGMGGAKLVFGQNNLFLRDIDNQYRDQFGADGAKIGDTLRIRLPNDYVTSDGPRVLPQAPEIPAPLALVAAAVAVAPAVLERPVTRRFWAK